MTGETYIPPERGVFTLTESIHNTGPQTVTIEAVSILGPQEQATDTPNGVAPWPLTPAGTARWTSSAPRSSNCLPAAATVTALDRHGR